MGLGAVNRGAHNVAITVPSARAPRLKRSATDRRLRDGRSDRRSGPAQLAEALVADPEVVSNLVDDRHPDLMDDLGFGVCIRHD